MTRIRDISNETFGRLRAIAWVGRTAGRKSLWECECECHAEPVITRDNLVTGHTRSCGCLQRDTVIAMNKQRAQHNV